MPRSGPNHWTLTKALPSHRKNEECCKKRECRMPGAPKMWGRQQRECMREWEAFLGNNLPHKSKFIFPKMSASLNSNLDCHTLPIPCNNQLNRLLAIINDWVNKTRKVVDSLMGSPFYIWIFPNGPRVWITHPSSPLILKKSCSHLIIVALT